MTRIHWSWLIGILGGVALTSGCGEAPTEKQVGSTSAAAVSAAQPTTASAAADATDRPPAEQAKSELAPAVGTPADQPAGQTVATSTPASPSAKGDSSAAEKIAPPTNAAAEPTTARAAIEKVNLLTLKKLNPKQEMESGPTNLFYFANATLDETNKFYETVLQEAGWMPTSHLVTNNDQYIDRLVTKDGYYVRLTISAGAERPKETSVSLSSLGNFDVRTLPRTSDAEAQDSSPVMAGHKTNQGLSEAADVLTKQMSAGGWQLCLDTDVPVADVPHYKSFRYRKHASRVNLGLVKDPTNPQKTIIFYHAEHVIPMDIPEVDHLQPLRLDPMVSSASLEWQGDRASVIALLEKHGQPLGWEFVNLPAYSQEKSSVLYIKTLPEVLVAEQPVGLAVRYVESKGKHSIVMERKLVPKANPTKAPELEQVAGDDQPTANETAAKSESSAAIDAEFAKVQAEANDLITQELTKALGSIGKSGGAPDMKALQAQAAELQATLGQSDADEPTTDASPEAKSNVSFDVPDDEEPIAEKDKKLTKSVCRIKAGEKEFVLENSVVLAKVEDGATTKILMFSNKPIKKAALEKKFFAGESVSLFDATEFSAATAEFNIIDDSVQMNIYADGVSLSAVSSQIKSTVRLNKGKMQGRITLDNPMEAAGKSLDVSAEVAQELPKR